jgi:putative flippase GtrA
MPPVGWSGGRTESRRVLSALVERFRSLLRELAKFGTVGFISLLIDLAVFNLMLQVLPDKPLTAKVVSTAVSATNAFVLNRHWSFKDRARSSLRREYVLFLVLNSVGLAISLLCLSISHYVLGFESVLASNVAANGVGLVLGTAFRFWSYRRFVWTAPEEVAAAAADGDAAAQAVLEDVRDGTLHR